jgi:hypothetical protein
LGNPSNGRETKASGARSLPWQALYRRPDPQGHGSRGPTTATSSELIPVTLVDFPE